MTKLNFESDLMKPEDIPGRVFTVVSRVMVAIRLVDGKVFCIDSNGKITWYWHDCLPMWFVKARTL